jgi:hypothetical protein
MRILEKYSLGFGLFNDLFKNWVRYENHLTNLKIIGRIHPPIYISIYWWESLHDLMINSVLKIMINPSENDRITIKVS